MIFTLKFILVLLLLAAGAFFLLHGLGGDIPVIKYKGMEANNLPAGAALLVVGLLLAVFWKTERKTTTIEEVGTNFFKRTIETTTKFIGPKP